MQEGKFEAEGYRVRKDGSTFWASVVINPLRDQTRATLIGFAKIRATSPSVANAAERCSAPRSSSRSRRRWRASAS